MAGSFYHITWSDLIECVVANSDVQLMDTSKASPVYGKPGRFLYRDVPGGEPLRFGLPNSSEDGTRAGPNTAMKICNRFDLHGPTVFPGWSFML